MKLQSFWTYLNYVSVKLFKVVIIPVTKDCFYWIGAHDNRAIIHVVNLKRHKLTIMLNNAEFTKTQNK